MPIAYLTRRAVFCASHRLHNPAWDASKNLAVFGKCNNPNGHGHNYVLEATVRGPVNADSGMVLNITDLKDAIEEAVMKPMDHKHLNLDTELFKKSAPTAENIAVSIWDALEKRLPKGLLYEVRLQETENISVTYRGEN